MTDTSAQLRIDPRTFSRRRLVLGVLLVSLLIVVITGFALPVAWPNAPRWSLFALLSFAIVDLAVGALVPRMRPKPVPDSELLVRPDEPKPGASLAGPNRSGGQATPSAKSQATRTGPTNQRVQVGRPVG